MVGAFAVIVLLLWMIIALLRLAVNNQVEQATSILEELERIRAGLFVITKIKKEEGWTEFEHLSRSVVTEYMIPGRLERMETVRPAISFWKLMRQI
jgi:HAMP domain-containing protein